MIGSTAIDPATARAVNLFGARVRSREPHAELVLFGSRARGDHTAESDVDVVVVTDLMASGRSAAAAVLADVAYDVLLQTGLLVAPLPLTRAEWNDSASFPNPRLLETIRTEGLAV